MRRAPEEAIGQRRLLGGSRASMAFLAGVLLTLPSAMYIAALKDIAQAGVSTGEEFLAIVLFNVLMLLPALIPWPCWSSRRHHQDGGRASRPWRRDHQKRLVTVVAGAIGVYLSAQGIIALADDRP